MSSGHCLKVGIRLIANISFYLVDVDCDGKNLVFWIVRIASISYGDVVSSIQSVIDTKYTNEKGKQP